jgi:hypothetical protein
MRKMLTLGLFAFGIYYMSIGGWGILNSLSGQYFANLIGSVVTDTQKARIVDHYTTHILNSVHTTSIETLETILNDINDDGYDDIIAIQHTDKTCGTGGCIATIFLNGPDGSLMPLSFQIAVKAVAVLESTTNGMHDLRLNHDETSRMIWNGSTYVHEQI